MKTYSINHIFIIEKSPTGGFLFSYSETEQRNIYRILREMGFRKDTTFYKITDGKKTRVYLSEIKRDFTKLLKSDFFKDIPTDLPIAELVKWFELKNPIVAGSLLGYYLTNKDFEEE